MRNPADCGKSLVKLASPCFASFAFFEMEAYEIFGDKDQILNAVSKAMTESTPANETSVREYASSELERAGLG